MRNLLVLIVAIGMISLLGGCSTLSVTKGRMLKTPLDYEYAKFDEQQMVAQYRIAVDDAIQLNMFANDGYNFISLTGSGSSGAGGGRGQLGGGSLNSYRVRSDSTIKVPIIGKVKVVGWTLEELEQNFEKILEKQFQSPFVTAQISNRRIYIFSGVSQASIFLLNNQNTTLFEVLAGTGGMPQNSNASKIKIIRGNLKDPLIYKVDLSTVGGMRDANLIMHAGDIVYIEPYINYAQIVSSDITSTLSLFTTGVLVYTLIKGD